MNDLEWFERLALFASVFFFFLGIGLIIDGRKLLERQYETASRVDYSNTLSLY